LIHLKNQTKNVALVLKESVEDDVEVEIQMQDKQVQNENQIHEIKDETEEREIIQTLIKMNRILIICCILFMVLSCSDNKIQYGAIQTVGDAWEKDEIVQFDIPGMDTAQAYNVYLNLRNNHHYPYNNIYLIVGLEYPNGKQDVDTLQYRMAYPNGEWMGDGIGSTKENLLWYKENFQFLEEGSYKISIQQAVRKNGQLEGDAELKGITDVGFSIERIQNE